MMTTSRFTRANAELVIEGIDLRELEGQAAAMNGFSLVLRMKLLTDIDRYMNG